MLKETGCSAQNYQGIDIPVSAGISFPMTLITTMVIYMLLGWYDNAYLLFIFGITAVSFLGFIDDRLGRRDTLGFKGHFGKLFKGKLTTGGLKALGGGMIALFLAFSIGGTWYDVLLNTFIIALFTNLLNLFDLRPGRAIKGFFFLLAIIAGFARFDNEWMFIVPLIGAVIIYFPVDLKAKAMMGDAGSNVLGLGLGYISALSLTLNLRIGVLIFLLAVHIYTERYSLTKTIEQNRVLRWIDELGR
ncbi:MAG: hypothetical protein H0Z36_06425 [Thermosyntropha sp.]|nr:hypothetical protein [Thermosyntropha sp.]